MARNVTFGRINRREPEQLTMEARPFRDDMETLISSGETQARYRAHLWIAADMRIEPDGDFATGILGFAERETFIDFDDEAFSWIKGPEQEVEGATGRTRVPFAVDLREDGRFVAFTTTTNIKATTFCRALTAALSEAVTRMSLVPLEWEVDLVAMLQDVREWLQEHPHVAKLTRVVKFPNPRADLFDEDRQRMRELHAQTKRETYTPRRAGELDLARGATFDELLFGVEEGYVDVTLESREGATKARFSTSDKPAQHQIPGYGNDLEEGTRQVLDALVEFLRRRDRQLRLDDGETVTDGRDDGNHD